MRTSEPFRFPERVVLGLHPASPTVTQPWSQDQRQEMPPTQLWHYPLVSHQALGWSPQDLHCLWMTQPCAHDNFSMVSYSAEFISLAGVLSWEGLELPSLGRMAQGIGGSQPHVCCQPWKLARWHCHIELSTAPWDERCPGGLLTDVLL